MVNASKCFAFLIVLMLAIPQVFAAPEKDPRTEQIRRLQQAQRKVEQERVRLDQEKSALQAQVKDLEGQAEGLKRQADAAGRRASVLGRELIESKKSLVEANERAEKRIREQADAILKSEAENRRLQAALTSEKQQLAVALERNKEMHKVSGEVLSLYEKKSCFDSAFQREPLTGLKRVEIENAVEDLRDKLDSQRAGS